MVVGAPALEGRLVDSALEPHLLQDLGRDLLDRAGRRVEPRDTMAAHQPLGVLDLVAAVLESCVAAVGPPLAADLGQALLLNRQAIEPLEVRLYRRRQDAAVEVVGGQRYVRRQDAELKRHVEASGRLAAAGYPDQDHIGAA